MTSTEICVAPPRVKRYAHRCFVTKRRLERKRQRDIRTKSGLDAKTERNDMFKIHWKYEQHIARRKNNNWSRHQNTCQMQNHGFQLCFAMISERVASIQTTGVNIQLVFALIWGSPGVHVRQDTVSVPFGGRATATTFTSIINTSELTLCF